MALERSVGYDPANDVPVKSGAVRRRARKRALRAGEDGEDGRGDAAGVLGVLRTGVGDEMVSIGSCSQGRGLRHARGHGSWETRGSGDGSSGSSSSNSSSGGGNGGGTLHVVESVRVSPNAWQRPSTTRPCLAWVEQGASDVVG